MLIKLVWCAKALGWSRKRTLRYFRRREAITVYDGYWFVSRSQLRRALPPGVWEEVAAQAIELQREHEDDPDDDDSDAA